MAPTSKIRCIPAERFLCMGPGSCFELRYCDSMAADVGLLLSAKDHWRLSGIHREVRVYCTDTTWIADYEVRTTELDPTTGAATVSVSVRRHLVLRSVLFPFRLFTRLLTSDFTAAGGHPRSWQRYAGLPGDGYTTW